MDLMKLLIDAFNVVFFLPNTAGKFAYNICGQEFGTLAGWFAFIVVWQAVTLLQFSVLLAPFLLRRKRAEAEQMEQPVVWMPVEEEVEMNVWEVPAWRTPGMEILYSPIFSSLSGNIYCPDKVMDDDELFDFDTNTGD
ncbi:hypothetical protein SAMN06265339_0688 [Desulfurobacterium pacificum]|uniref:Uncharacterized protein n=2 Tax=Desulfurobacterium pacificum TaxID=240166 RepID=A0ABY1NGD5_9BACT|nr:hypothetical protein SAMN06265339_0688 [Desulfurobacterium pacificum]